MEFFRIIFKILAALIGLPLTLGGFFGFFYGIFQILNKNTGEGILLAIASVFALTIGTLLGKFSRGDYD